MKYLVAALTAFAAPAYAQDFSDGSQAGSWNLYAEVPARFEAKVVDLLCELTGDCPQDCGAGRRQLGLLRSADNVLVLAMKNNQPLFTGAAVDLAPIVARPSPPPAPTPPRQTAGPRSGPSRTPTWRATVPGSAAIRA